MQKEVLFIHGAGGGAYEADEFLADSLQHELGEKYMVRYPQMPDEENAPYNLWVECIKNEMSDMTQPIILVGHSLGASVLAKYLSSEKTSKRVAGVFLINAPYWGGAGWTYDGYEEMEIRDSIIEDYLPNVPLLLYQARDDEIVPFDHLSLYSSLFPTASTYIIESGGHQLNNDLSAVARDIKSL